MKKYLKMSDYFVTGTFSADYGDIHSVIKYKPSDEGLTSRVAHYAVEHAINSHDELVAMNKELLDALEHVWDSIVNDSLEVMNLDPIKSAIKKAKAAS